MKLMRLLAAVAGSSSINSSIQHCVFAGAQPHDALPVDIRLSHQKLHIKNTLRRDQEEENARSYSFHYWYLIFSGPSQYSQGPQ